jgi:hypothetical protein
VRKILEFVGITCSKPTVVFCDNQATIAMCSHPNPMSRTKHIAVREFWMCSEIEKGTIRLEYIPSKKNLADGLTKALPISEHKLMMSKLGTVSV